jgi:hypothetical protein
MNPLNRTVSRRSVIGALGSAILILPVALTRTSAAAQSSASLMPATRTAPPDYTAIVGPL